MWPRRQESIWSVWTPGYPIASGHCYTNKICGLWSPCSSENMAAAGPWGDGVKGEAETWADVGLSLKTVRIVGLCSWCALGEWKGVTWLLLPAVSS